MITASELKRGVVFRAEGHLYQVVSAEHHMGGGKMGGVEHIRIKDLESGSIVDRRFRPEEKIELVEVDKRKLEYLYQDGDFFCAVPAPEGTRYLVLFTECPGEAINYDREPEKIARRYGQAVAEMHNALDDFSSPHLRFEKDLRHFTEKPLQHIEPFLRDRREDWVYLQQIIEKLRQRILAMPANELEMGFCHGDLQGYHANLGADGTLTFFDFDCGGYGYRAYDLAVFLWCCRLEDAVAVRWEPFVKGYRQRRIIDNLDMQAVPLFVCARYLWHMSVHTQNAPDWGVEFLNKNYFDTHLKRLREAEAD